MIPQSYNIKSLLKYLRTINVMVASHNTIWKAEREKKLTSGDALWEGSFASLSLELLSLSESEPELLSDPLWLLESSLELSAPSLVCWEGSELLGEKGNGEQSLRGFKILKYYSQDEEQVTKQPWKGLHLQVKIHCLLFQTQFSKVDYMQLPCILL